MTRPPRFLRTALLVGGACLQAMLHAAESTPPPAAPLVPTVITSAGPSEMISSATETTFTFRDQVVVTGTNLKITCDRLVVVAKRTGDPKATLGKQENFKSLIATGHVRIVQNEREATCGRAEVLPGEDKVILSESPKVRSLDGKYVADGPRMILERGQQRAVIEGGSRFTLPPLKDLGFDKEKKPAPTDGAAKPGPPK